MSSLASKYVFYRPEHKANGGPLKLNFEVLCVQRWNEPSDRAQRVDRKYHTHEKKMGYTPELFFWYLLMNLEKTIIKKTVEIGQ